MIHGKIENLKSGLFENIQLLSTVACDNMSDKDIQGLREISNAKSEYKTEMELVCYNCIGVDGLHPEYGDCCRKENILVRMGFYQPC